MGTGAAPAGRRGRELAVKPNDSANGPPSRPLAGPQHVRVLAVSASLRARSASRSALGVACEAVCAAGGTVDWLDLREYPLPWFDNRDDESTYPPIVHEVRRRFAAADAYLLATPQFHTGPSGVLRVPNKTGLRSGTTSAWRNRS